jgi:DNA-binding MarR family transcriptional regulator
MNRESATREHVADRLHSAAIHVLRRVRQEDEASGLGPARLSALSVVVFGGPLTLGELAAAEQVRPPTMTRIVDGLVREGLVRKRQGEDRRTIVITATTRGQKLLQRARERRIAVLAGRLAELADDDLELLERAAELMEAASRRHDD